MALIKTYFSHDINSLADPKIVIMINLHGVISYAWWWMLLEKLAEAPDYKLPCNKFTYLGLSIVMDIRPETLVFSKCLANAKQTEANESKCLANIAKVSNEILLQKFINSLINDCNLLETDGEYFWSPGLMKRATLRESKNSEISEKRRQAGRLGGLAKKKFAKQTEANAKQTEANAKQNLANLANNIKENNIKDIEREIRAREDDDPISAFEDSPVSKNKKVYEFYMKNVGEISPVIKERLDDLVEVYGVDNVIVAINTTHEAGGKSIKYVETVAASNLKKEVNKANGSDRRGGGNRKAKQTTDGSEVDWSKETGEWL
ncbi:MAG: DUF4373 domain-containing protein [Candidatus Saccharimonas sp.]|nr:MAG: DUF4373 domain-containing protein [Candidatus Saccharimonas sp.]